MSSNDLVLERIVDVSPELIWKAWTTPEHIKQWFTPAPWKTVECILDLRPGGRFYTVMQSPEGESFPNEACFLEIVEKRKLVFTDALHAGYRPADKPNHCIDSHMTAIVEFIPHEKGTKYLVTALHPTAEARDKHKEIGFFDGWNAALDQLLALAKTWK